MLVTDGTRSFAIYLYADGFIHYPEVDDIFSVFVEHDYGDGINIYRHPDTGTENITNIVNTSNVNVPGMWIFRLDEEDIATGRCINQDAGVYYSKIF